VKQLFYELGGRLFERLLGCDGSVTAALLAFAMWCGHYAVRAGRRRPGEVLVLVPLSVSSFTAAGLSCDNVWKFLALATVAVIAYAAMVNASDAGRSAE
jgi:hypothetical protein